MPPANSRTTSPANVRQTSPPPNDPLSYLSSPVLDLASTLHTHAADEADEANASFLRNSLDSLGQVSQEHPPRSYTHVDSNRDPRQRASATSNPPQVSSESIDDLSRRERLQRVLARLNRIQDPAAGSSATAYSNRTPSPNRQRLYDWAPSHSETAQQEDHLLYGYTEQLRREHSQSQADSSRRRTRDSAALPSAADLTDAADRRERLRERRRRESEWVSLRSRAVMQRARQESSPSAGMERMLRYVMERERSGMSEEEERARNSGWFHPGSNRSSGEQQHMSSASSREPWPLPPSASELRTRTMQERADAMQRRYLAENAPPRLPRISTPPVPTTSSPSSSSPQFLESALKYLNKLRSCYRYEDALSAAMDHGLATKEFFADKHDDFIMDVAEINPIAGSSWLQPCTIFEGHQHAINSNAGLLQSRPASATSHGVEQINPNFRSLGGSSFDHPPGSTRVQPFDATRPWLSHRFTPPLYSASVASAKPPDPGHDHWPVRVIIHSIDTEKMTLQGTMEAYDVPQHPASVSILNSTERPKAGKKHAPITTYLEGHIVDLATHSFLTPSATETKRAGPHPTTAENTTPYTTLSDSISFPAANAHTDASNWRKLPPFNQLSSDEETARCILSKARMNEIHEEYIFMRWKERCFVHTKDDRCSEVDRGSDQDRGHGLTISGFYYVSLRRSDGAVEGLYFDPTSTPYQHLRLRGHQAGWPVFEFR